MAPSRAGSRSRLLLLVGMLAGFLLLLAAPVAASDGSESGEPDLVLFWAEGCPYCEAEREFLGDLQDELPDMVVAAFEVSHSEANRELFIDMMASAGSEARNVPSTIVGDLVWVGWSDAVGEQIRAAVAERLAAGTSANTWVPEAADASSDEITGSIVDVPLIGEVDVARRSLFVATLFIAAVDGLNPCSLWVLSILLALVLHTGSRRRVFSVGATFLVVTTILYGLFIAGLYSALSYIAYVDWIRFGVAAVALTFGVINVKDYFAYKRGVSLTISEERKPWLYRKMRGLTAASTPLPAVLAGTTALAVGVSLIETPCTAGFPLLWTDLLADQGVGLVAAAGLFGIYMLVFLADEIAVFVLTVFAMQAIKLEERHGRVLKLVGGMVMVTLAATLVLLPETMESVTGAVGVFAVAAAATAGAIGIERWRTGRRSVAPVPRHRRTSRRRTT